MYGFDEYSNLSPEQILQKVTQEQIFEWILQKPLDLGKRYKAPYREDNTPRCWLEYKAGGLMFMDFSPKTAKSHKSCFGVLMEIYGVGMHSAIDIICKQFGLSTNDTDYKPVERAEYITIEKLPTIITPEHQEYTRKDKIYWSQYLIKIEDLEEDRVYSTSRYLLQSSRGTRWFVPYSHCYDIDFIDAHKIYLPLRPPEYRWITNCNEDHIGNFDNLPPSGDILFIQKSYKDHRVMRNLQKEYNVIWFQNEGCVPSMHLLENLSSRFQFIYVFYDNDYSGIIAALKITAIFNNIRDNSTRTVYLPVGPKNISDLVKVEGRADTLKILNRIL